MKIVDRAMGCLPAAGWAPLRTKHGLTLAHWPVLVLVVGLLGIAPLTHAQDSAYTARYLERSTKFAWTTLGGDVLTLTGGNTEFWRGNQRQQTSFGPSFIPRLTIGGVHFWGHTDFYVSFPLLFLALQDRPAGLAEFSYLQGIETGAKLYPWRLRPQALRPFVGISMRLLSFSHQPEGSPYQHAPNYQKMMAPVQAGLTYATAKYLISATAHYQSLQQMNYTIAPGQQGRTEFAPLSFQVSFLRYWDTDRSMRTRSGIAQENLKHELLEKERRFSAWYWGLGPSAGLQMSRSEWLQNSYPYLYDDFLGGFMPDVTFGRFFAQPDLNLGLSYRTLGARMRGFDTQLRFRRHSFMLEGYKNLFNYLGFVPFVGLTASVEHLRTTVDGRLHQTTKPALGLIFGWDIRVTKTGTNLLRTNLRWIPGLYQRIDGQKMMFDSLEFNFIQWVQFIGRKKLYERHRSNS
jgi:hypothetical protein